MVCTSSMLHNVWHLDRYRLLDQFIDLYKDHPCLWNIKHCACSQEHVAEWLLVVVVVVIVAVGLKVMAITQYSMRSPHSVYASSGWQCSTHFWHPDRPHCVLCFGLKSYIRRNRWQEEKIDRLFTIYEWRQQCTSGRVGTSSPVSCLVHIHKAPTD